MCNATHIRNGELSNFKIHKLASSASVPTNAQTAVSGVAGTAVFLLVGIAPQTP